MTPLYFDKDKREKKKKTKLIGNQLYSTMYKSRTNKKITTTCFQYCLEKQHLDVERHCTHHLKGPGTTNSPLG
jgi:hypothetical protein